MKPGRKKNALPATLAATLLVLLSAGLSCTPPPQDVRTSGKINLPTLEESSSLKNEDLDSNKNNTQSTQDPATNDRIVEVARKPSLFGEIIVFDHGEYRCLAFNDYENLQSCVNRSLKLDFRFEYIKMMFVTSLAVRDLGKVLILGLGGGSLPRLFSAVYPEAVIDVVEIDPAVVEAAQKFMGYKAAKKTRLHILDAAEFVKKKGRSRKKEDSSSLSGYDLILVDCYDDKDIPEHLLTDSFIINLAALAKPDSLVAVNLAMDTPHYTTTVVRYSEHFTGIWLMKGIRSGNHILVFGNNFADRETINQRAAEADKKLPFSSKKILKTFGGPGLGRKTDF